ncbi:MAG TPA: discoidin domain-containing protein [Trebonia sp.]|nr:discoidin domain-containing protein [Trebonia sp.]
MSLLAFAALVVSLLVAGLGATAPKASAATCGTTNIALNQPATASSLENASFPASNAVDGNTGTRWSSAFSDPQWLEVDLGSSQSICGVTLNWEAAYATAFQIQVSTDNTNWTSIYSTTTGTGGTQNLTGLSGTGRYIRMYGTTRATQYGYSLWEFQVFATSSGGTGTGGVDISAGGPAAAPFVADEYYSGGTATSTTTAISTTGITNPAPQSVWQHNRYGNFTYTIPGLTAGANYSVRLDFAEEYWTAAGSRTFNVLINGTQVLTNFDIFATAGGEYKGVAESFTATASSAGAVTIQFVTVKDNAQVNGIEVQPAGGGTGNTVTVTNPGAETWTVNTAASLQIQASDSASGQTLTYSATGLPAGLSINSSSGQISGTPTTAGTGSATVTATDTTGASGSATFSWTVNAAAAGCVGGSDQPNFGPNVYIFTPSESATTINNTLNTVFNSQKVNQFGTQRYAELFMPGTYTGIEDNVGYYVSVQGLGQNPSSVQLNNSDVTVDSFDGTGNATDNFWRSAENMEITPSAGNDRWAVAQAGPFERMDINGGLELYPASYGYASGGYIADSIVTGQASSVSQQQYYTKDSTLGSWSGSVWNMVFSGVNGAPAQSYPTPPMTTLASTPVARDIPYLYVDSSGNYNVFEPSLRTNAVGPSWSPTSNTPGTSVPMSTFFVATPSNTAAQINAALAEGCNLLFTPGVYSISQTINVNNPNTVVLGLGFPTLIPTGGVDTMHIADVDGVRLQGLLFDAGTTNSSTLLQVGPAGSSASHASNPTSIQDVFFRIGGDIAGQATNSLVVNSNNALLDDIWAWRADHGNSGTVGWTVNTAQHGLVVNGNNVLATGLFVEHYQNYDVQWFGNGGETIFFQNEMPYDPPNQAAWMNGSSDGYAAYEVGPSVTTHTAYGLGSYCYFNINPAVVADHAFEAPTGSGIHLNDLLTVSLGNVGVIEHVVNETGAATPTNTTPSTVTSFP